MKIFKEDIMKLKFVLLNVVLLANSLFGANLDRISSVINDGDVELVMIGDERDKNIEKEFYIFKDGKFSLVFQSTRLKEKDISSILFESPDYQALLYVNLKIFENKKEKETIKIFFDKSYIFSIINGKIYENSDLFNFLLSYFKDNEYEKLFCISSKKHKLFDIFMKYLGIDKCEIYQIMNEKREKINQCDEVEKAIGYDCTIWEKAKVKHNSGQFIIE
jgi:hypothetical protein